MKAKVVYIALALVLVFSLATVAVVPAMPVGADTDVFADQSGTWTVANSPYIVTADVTVPGGQTLTIDPGVTVKFNPGTSLIVNGNLVAEGTSGSNIVFTSNAGSPAANDWWRIQFNIGSTGSMKYCDIAYGTIPIYLKDVDGSEGDPAVTIENCNIHDSGDTLISLITSDYNTIKWNTVTLIDIGQAIWLDSSSHNLVEGNTCTSLGTHGTGIRLVANNGAYSDNIVRGNTVHDVALGITINTAEGMNATDILIEGNTCYDNTNGIGLESSYGGVAQDITVTGNTLYNHSSSTIFSRTWRWPTWVEPHPWGTFSNVNIIGNDITATKGVTIGLARDPDVGYLEGESDVTGFHVNYNNLLCTLYGAKNVGTGTLDATNNWWGDASGPSGVGYGTGDAVSSDVNYDPWLDASYPGGDPIRFTDAMTYSVTDGGTVDASAVADTEVVVTGSGSTNVTAAEYSSNPGAGFSGDMGKYIDVHISGGAPSEIEIRLHYTDGEVAGLVESSLTLKYWNGSAWVDCSNTGVNTADVGGYSGYMWAIIDGGSTPDLSYLSGGPFGGGGSPAPAPTPTPEEGHCFIATAAYGTSTATEIDTLRDFRDEVLLESTLGSQLVALYYEVSPPVADFISEHEGLRTLVRELLVDPVVWLVDAIGTLWRD